MNEVDSDQELYPIPGKKEIIDPTQEQIKRGRHNYDAQFRKKMSDSARSRTGELSPNWKGGQDKINSYGYVMEYIVSANESMNKWCNTKGINYYEGIEALGNLFKHAVPKLEYVKLYKAEHHLDYGVEVTLSSKKVVRLNPAPAFALFWAICEVKDGRD